MKKNTFWAGAVLAAAVLTSALSVSAADESDMMVFDSYAVQAAIDEEGLSGRYVTFEDYGYKVWIPDQYEEIDLTASDIDDGYLARYVCMPQGNGPAGVISIGRTNCESSTVDGYISQPGLQDYELVERAEVNGEEAAFYFTPDELEGRVEATIALPVGEGTFFEVTSGPYNDPYYTDLCNVVFHSVQPADAESTENHDEDEDLFPAEDTFGAFAEAFPEEDIFDAFSEAFPEEISDAQDDAADATTISWAEIEAEEDASDFLSAGEFFSLEDSGWKIWIPSVMKPAQLNEDDKEAGYIGYFTTADQKAIISAMTFDESVSDAASYKALLQEKEGVSELTDFVVNGMPAVGWQNDEQDITFLDFVEENGKITEFSFTPSSDEDFASFILVIASSIQPE